MNRILDLLKSIPLKLLEIINNLDKKTEESIKQGAVFLGFIILIIAIIAGYMMGKDEARIKDAPLAEYVNDAFRIDISREKDDSALGKMLESELIAESRYSGYRKIQYPSQDIIEQETDDTVFTPSIREKRTAPEPAQENSVIEGRYRPEMKKPEVSPVQQKHEKDEALIENKTGEKSTEKPIEKKSSPAPNLMIDEGVVE